MPCSDCPIRKNCRSICEKLEDELPNLDKAERNEVLTGEIELFHLLFHSNVHGIRGFNVPVDPSFKEQALNVLDEAMEELTPKQRNALRQVFFESEGLEGFLKTRGGTQSGSYALVNRALESLKSIILRKMES